MNTKFWSENILNLDKDEFQILWREHSDIVHIDLISKWLHKKSFDKVFKTDLFDEYVCAGLYPFLTTKSKALYGIDLSESIGKTDTATLRHRIIQRTGHLTRPQAN